MKQIIYEIQHYLAEKRFINRMKKLYKGYTIVLTRPNTLTLFITYLYFLVFKPFDTIEAPCSPLLQSDSVDAYFAQRYDAKIESLATLTFELNKEPVEVKKGLFKYELEEVEITPEDNKEEIDVKKPYHFRNYSLLEMPMYQFLKLVLSRCFMLPAVESYLNYFYRIKRYDLMRIISYNLPSYLAVDVFMSSKDDPDPVELYENNIIRTELDAESDVEKCKPCYHLAII